MKPRFNERLYNKVLDITKDFLYPNRPFPHYAPVRKQKEMRTRLGWEISYKSLYFVHPRLESVSFCTGMRERSIIVNYMKKNFDIGESLFTFFCVISIGFSLSDEANKTKFLNIERA